MLHIIKINRLKFISSLVLLIIGTYSTMLSPLFFKKFLEEQELYSAILVLSISALSLYWSYILQQILSRDSRIYLREKCFKHILFLKDDIDIERQKTLIIDDIENYSNHGFRLLYRIYQGIFGIIIASCIIYYSFDSSKVILSLSTAFIIVISNFLIMRLIEKLDKEYREYWDKIKIKISNMIMAKEEIRNTVQYDNIIRTFKDSIDKIEDIGLRIDKVEAFGKAILNFMNDSYSLICAIILVFIINRGMKINTTDLITILSYIAYMIWPIKNLANGLPLVFLYLNSKRRIESILSLQEERIDGYKIDNINSIKLIGNFSYNNDKEVLRNINVEFNKGKKIALVGRSGSGKSTIIKLILGKFFMDKGSVYFDDISINQLSLDSIRNMIGYVPQKPMLIDSTLKDNLLLFNPNITDLECKEVLNDSGLAGWDLNMQIGRYGNKLSGGEAQRVAIARVLLRRELIKVIMLDEATSSLDNITESEVINIYY